MPQNSRDIRQCQLCGQTFDASGLMCHTSCPMSAGCSIVCCPNCGYQTPDESQMRLSGALKSFWENRKKSEDEVRSC